MARKTITQITDDIDGSSNAEEVTFSLMGVDYTIDLSKKNRAALEKALKPYMDAGSRVRRRTRSTSSPKRSATSKSASSLDLRAVRTWASANGHEVSTRGRVPQSVLEAYQEAHN